MVRFLSQEWIELVNQMLAAAPPADFDATSIAASDGRFTVSEVVHDAPPELAHPGAPVTVTLRVDGAVVQLEPGGTDAASHSDVVISLSYEDAAALNRGELDAAAALAQGRVRVRGDLSVLVAGQQLLSAAGARLHDGAAAIVY
jgi:hypothetical protein